ncbi:MAG: cob(I)yrinic acid a,c-diamide adenosyltransferase [Chloracidobacterium sp.]|nr:cob(I)yrinic acid a,c-diamide adenosyltransferase [Chloracidobacterium sp.]
MSSIATKRGDKGETNLIGGSRVPKSDLRVEAYGTLDELGSQIAFARSICDDAEVNERAKEIQKELFLVNSVIATVPDGKRTPPEVPEAMIDRLSEEVLRIEAIEGIIGDWSLPGDLPAAAAFDVARTVCRRAERVLVRLTETDDRPQLANVITYVNRLSDLIWLYGRLLEVRAGIDSRLRDETNIAGNKWSKAW